MKVKPLGPTCASPSRIALDFYLIKLRRFGATERRTRNMKTWKIIDLKFTETAGRLEILYQNSMHKIEGLSMS